MAKSYFEKLKDPRWQKIRLEVLQRDEFTCQLCGDEKSTLHVHHIDYTGDDPWLTELHLLVTLCEQCHQEETDNLKISEKNLIKTLKSRGFLSRDFDSLKELMIKMPFIHANEVQLSALEWYLTERNVDIILSKFFDHLSRKNRK